MKLYFKSQRSIFVDKTKILSGGRLDKEGKQSGYIDPENVIEVTEDLGKKLRTLYPSEFMNLEELLREGPASKMEKADRSTPAGEK